MLICPFHPNISMHILHTALYACPWVRIRRICLRIKVILLVIISFILRTLLFDPGVILYRETEQLTQSLGQDEIA